MIKVRPLLLVAILFVAYTGAITAINVINAESQNSSTLAAQAATQKVEIAVVALHNFLGSGKTASAQKAAQTAEEVKATNKIVAKVEATIITDILTNRATGLSNHALSCRVITGVNEVLGFDRLPLISVSGCT